MNCNDIVYTCGHEEFITINTLTELNSALSEKLIVAYLLRFPAIYGPTKIIC